MEQLICLAYSEINKCCSAFDKKSNIIELIKSNYAEDKYKIYDLSSNSDIKKEQEDIVKIKKDRTSTIVVLITNNKNLFTNFNRPIQLIENKIYKSLKELSNQNHYINVSIYDLIRNLKYARRLNIHNLNDDIDLILNQYGKIFEIDIKLLTKETTYSTDNKNELLEFLKEDIDMFKCKHILTSRFSIILYRLFFFDLNATSTAIGNFYREELNVKSESYKFNNLNNNRYDIYFPTLSNKSFRGYEIPLLKRRESPPDFFSEKIKIAKNLLNSDVNIKVISKAIEMEVDELKRIIYGKEPEKQKESEKQKEPKTSSQSQSNIRGAAKLLKKKE